MPLPALGLGGTVSTMRLRVLLLAALVLFSGCIRRVEEKTTITWWQFWTDPQARPVIQELVSTFELENPEIKVDVVDLTWAEGHQKIVVAFATGSTPDVLELGSDWVAEFSHKDLLLDLTEEAERQRDLYMKWEPVTHQGRIYGYPWLLGTRALFYNKDLFYRAGLDLDKPPETWTEWLAQAKAINGLGDDVFGFAANSFERHRLYKKFLPFFWSNGGALFSDDKSRCLLDSKAGVSALEFYVSLCDEGLIEAQRELDLAFQRGRIGFTISGDWLLGQLRRNPDAPRYGVALIPRPEGGTSISFAGGEYLVVPKTSPHAQEAQLFVSFLLRPENNLKLCRAIGFVPASRAAAQNAHFTDDPYLAVFGRQLESARPTPVHPQWMEMEEEIERAVETAMFKALTPDSALSRAAREIDGILSD
jgi:multiple sugar transport system substrate-binding protein